jgi:hypothetical protein
MFRIKLSTALLAMVVASELLAIVAVKIGDDRLAKLKVELLREVKSKRMLIHNRTERTISTWFANIVISKQLVDLNPNAAKGIDNAMSPIHSAKFKEMCRVRLSEYHSSSTPLE